MKGHFEYCPSRVGLNKNEQKIIINKHLEPYVKKKKKLYVIVVKRVDTRAVVLSWGGFNRVPGITKPDDSFDPFFNKHRLIIRYYCCWMCMCVSTKGYKKPGVEIRVFVSLQNICHVIRTDVSFFFPLVH